MPAPPQSKVYSISMNTPVSISAMEAQFGGKPGLLVRRVLVEAPDFSLP
jgi:hypothetical protein